MVSAVRLVDEAWGVVAEQRLDDLLAGRVQGVPAEEVFEKAKRLVTEILPQRAQWFHKGHNGNGSCLLCHPL